MRAISDRQDACDGFAILNIGRKLNEHFPEISCCNKLCGKLDFSGLKELQP
jgi:hypothetical protein